MKQVQLQYSTYNYHDEVDVVKYVVIHFLAQSK